jgi:DinB family protein
MPTDAERAERLLATLERRWEALLGSYDGLPAKALDEPGVVGEWSIRNVIAHISIWEMEAIKHLPVIAAGNRPPRYSVKYGGIDAFNDQMMAGKIDLPLEETLRLRDDTHTQLIGYLHSLPPEFLATNDRFRRRLRLDTYGHYAIHSADIQEWRASRKE